MRVSIARYSQTAIAPHWGMVALEVGVDVDIAAAAR